MTVNQLHESTRGYAARAVGAGKLSVKLIAYKAGISASHASLFVHGHKRLSIKTLSRLLAALGFEVELLAKDTSPKP